jgi:hypothetical protein
LHIFAISSILEPYGDISYNFALTGVLIGATLLLLSAFWHQARSALLKEIAIRKAEDDKDYSEIDTLFNLLSHPFDEQLDLEIYTNEAPDWAQNLEVSCSS